MANTRSSASREATRLIALGLVQGEIEEIKAELEPGFDNWVAADQTVERAYMLAEQFIEQCGFDMADSDQGGDEMGGTVRESLAFAFLRIGVDSVMEAVS
jgi:hypothetical protein